MLFAAAEAAVAPVAGVPAAARVARAAHEAGVAHCRIVAPEGITPDAFTLAELARLAPGLAVSFGAAGDPLEAPALLGEDLPDAAAIRAALAAPPAALMPLDRAASRSALNRAGRAIVRATAKPSDGIVSRTLNRPISQALTRATLAVLPAIRPFHATLATIALALAMVGCLLLGTEAGLMAGAVLFQAASIVDGVDGEIARAAFRTSPEGARLDSLVDAATNLGFIAGVTLNVWLQGERLAGYAGAAGLTLFGLGLWLIGRRSKAADGALTFNAVKEHFAERPSLFKQLLTWLTMRDFFALAGALFILTGHAVPGLLAFAVVAAGWFVVVAVVTARHAA